MMSFHAIERAWEHHGFMLYPKDLARMRQVAATSNSPFVIELRPSPATGDRAVAIRVRGSWLPVVVARDGNIVTTLPPHCLDPARHKIESREREISARFRSASS
jgi:hypothetical protein